MSGEPRMIIGRHHLPVPHKVHPREVQSMVAGRVLEIKRPAARDAQGHPALRHKQLPLLEAEVQNPRGCRVRERGP